MPTSEADAVRDQLNRRPTFFGCNPTDTSSTESPLVIYIPNAPPSNGGDPVTNTDSFKLKYTDKHVELFLEQAFGSATSGFIPGQLGADPEWPKCLQCAAVDRQRFKASVNGGTVIPRSSQCETCFDRYCYDPANPPSADKLAVVGRKLTFVDPDPQPSFFERHKKAIIIAVSVVGGLLVAGLAVFIICFCCMKRRAKAIAESVKRARQRAFYQPVHARNQSTAHGDGHSTALSHA